MNLIHMSSRENTMTDLDVKPQDQNGQTAPPATRKRVVKPAEQRRREILDAALGLFRAKGYNETTVQDIASAAEVAAGTVYLHYSSKEDMLRALHEEFHDGMASRISEVMAEVFEGLREGETVDYREVIDTVLKTTVDYSVSKADLCDVAMKYLPGPELVNPKRSFAAFLGRVLEAGSELGLLHVKDPEMTAYLLDAAIGMNIGSAIAYGVPEDLPRFLEAAKELLYKALAPVEGSADASRS
jgi:AcrR family transcriptional regulator